MGKPHKYAELGLLVTTGLGDAEIARLAKWRQTRRERIGAQSAWGERNRDDWCSPSAVRAAW